MIRRSFLGCLFGALAAPFAAKAKPATYTSVPEMLECIGVNPEVVAEVTAYRAVWRTDGQILTGASSGSWHILPGSVDCP